MERPVYDVIGEARRVVRYGFKRVIRQTRKNTIPQDDVHLVKRPNAYSVEIDVVARMQWNNSDPALIRDEIERVAERAWFRSF